MAQTDRVFDYGEAALNNAVTSAAAQSKGRNLLKDHHGAERDIVLTCRRRRRAADPVR